MANAWEYDQNKAKNTYSPDKWSQGQAPTTWDQGRNPYLKKIGSTTTSYDGWERNTQNPSGTFNPWQQQQDVNDLGFSGTWTKDGRTTSDLGGLLQKESLQKTGSDFSAEQNQLAGLLNDPSKIQQTAGYQFDVDQGNQAINRSAAARGQLGGGGVLAELARYGQGMASKEYGNQVNRLSNLIGQKQQFGLGSGYYDELKTPNFNGGGSSRSGAATKPQNDPYADLAARENAQMAAHKKIFADLAVSDEKDRIAGNQRFSQTYGKTPQEYYGPTYDPTRNYGA